MLYNQPMLFEASVVAVDLIRAVDSNNLRQHLFRFMIFKINVCFSVYGVLYMSK